MHSLKLVDPPELLTHQVEQNEGLFFLLSGEFSTSIPIPKVTGVTRRLFINSPASTADLVVQGYRITPGSGTEFYYYSGSWFSTADAAAVDVQSFPTAGVHTWLRPK